MKIYNYNKAKIMIIIKYKNSSQIPYKISRQGNWKGNWDIEIWK